MPLTVIWRLLFSASPRLRSAVLFFVMATSLFANAQSSKPSTANPGTSASGPAAGFSVPGGTKDTHTMNAGVRLGKVLTDDHLGGFLRGNFELSADLMPIYYIWQPAQLKMPMLLRLIR